MAYAWNMREQKWDKVIIYCISNFYLFPLLKGIACLLSGLYFLFSVSFFTHHCKIGDIFDSIFKYFHSFHFNMCVLF